MKTCSTCRGTFDDALAYCPADGTPLSSANGGTEGKILADRYRLVSLLGEGGMGCVYLAEHVVLGRKVAVKVLREELSVREDLARRFQLEAAAASQIGHENIADVTDFGRTPEGSLFYVMEFVGGQSLSGLLRSSGPVPAARAVPIVIQVAKALGAAHQRGIIHRDLKPDNVLLQPRADAPELVKVVDFGISKFTELGPERLTRTGAVVGTPEYMAPEQASGDGIDHRIDIYALGVVAYEILTGTLPFRGDTVVATMMKHHQEPPEPFAKRRPDLRIPPDVEAAVFKLLEKRREDRPATMEDVVRLFSSCALSGPDVPWAAASESPKPVEPIGQPRISIPPQPHAVLASTARRVASSPDFPSTLVPEPVPAAPAAAVAPTAAAAPAPVPAPVQAVPSVAIESPLPPLPGRSKMPVVMVVGALAILFGGIALLKPAKQEEARSEPVAAVRTPEVAPSPAPKVEPAPEPKKAEAPAAAKVTVRSNPSGATVTGPTGALGRTPLEITVGPGEHLSLQASLAGYLPASRTLSGDEKDVELTLARAPAAVRAAPRKTEPTDSFEKVEDLKPNPFR